MTDDGNTALKKPDNTKTLTTAAQKIHSCYSQWRSSLRSLNQFFGVRHFSCPKSWKQIQQRVEKNSSYFLSNYVLISSIFCSLIMVINPNMFYGLIFLIVFWIVLLGSQYSLKLKIASFELSIQYRNFVIICFLLTMLIVYWLDILSVFTYALFASIACNISHMVFHKSKKISTTNIDGGGNVSNKAKFSDLSSDEVSDDSEGVLVNISDDDGVIFVDELPGGLSNHINGKNGSKNQNQNQTGGSKHNSSGI